MSGGKLLQFGICNGLLQGFILKFGHFSALCTNHVMMGFGLIGTLVLGRGAKLMLDNQIGIDKQNDGVIEGCSTHPELAVGFHIVIQFIYTKLALDAIDGIKYGIARGRLTLPVGLQILGQYLPYCIFYILFHTDFLFECQS